MTDRYVRSGGAYGAGVWSGSPYTTLAAALGAGAAGDRYFVSDDHAETQGTTLTLAFPGTLANPDSVYCADHTVGTTPGESDLRISAIANIATTGATGIVITGCAYIRGIETSLGTGSSGADFTTSGAAVTTDIVFDQCLLYSPLTSGGRIMVSNSGNNAGIRLTLLNTKIQWGNANATINIMSGGEFYWKNTATAIQGTAPTNLFSGHAQGAGIAYLDGVDLSAMSSKTLVQAQPKGGSYFFKDCKLPATVTICGSGISTGSGGVYLIRSDSGTSTTRFEKYVDTGVQTTELTVVRTGGVSVDGVAVSSKVVTTVNARPNRPFQMTPLVAYNTVTGSTVNVTVYGIWGGGAVPNNNDVWMEVGYLGSAATPLLTLQSTGLVTPLTAAGATSSDGSTWGGSTTAFKLTAALSSPAPQMIGPLYVNVFVGATSSTVYIDPQVVLS